MLKITRRLMSIALAAFVVAVLAFAAPKPAEAAPLTTGIGTSINDAQTSATQQVYWRRGYYGRPRFYGRPVFYGRSCWTRPRMVMTPWGWRRRLVRVCG